MIGARFWRVAFRHVLPNCVAPLVVQSTFNFAVAIQVEAALSFLGVGTPPGIPSWGNMLAEARVALPVAPWASIFPGSAITLMVLALNLLGDALRDYLDPRIRRGAR
jgi:peptide/nickel transport system permease protein